MSSRSSYNLASYNLASHDLAHNPAAGDTAAKFVRTPSRPRIAA